MGVAGRVKGFSDPPGGDFRNSGGRYKTPPNDLARRYAGPKKGQTDTLTFTLRRPYTVHVERGSGYSQIGEAANRAGLTQRTLRYYEELGLLKPASRMEGGFRLYSPEDMERIEYIKNLRDVLGFSLAEIKDMVGFEDERTQIKTELHQAENLDQRRGRLMQLKEVALRQMRIVNEKRQRLKEMRTGIQTRIDRIDAQLQ